MRRIRLLFVAFAALAPVAACGGEEPPPATPKAVVTEPPPPPPEPKPEPPPPPKPSMAELEKQALGDALAALNGQDAKKFASIYAEDGVISVAGLNDVMGRPAVEQNMAEWFETFKDVKLGFSRVWVKNDTLVVEWVLNGKHHGELFGVKGTEQPIGHYGLSVVTMNADGKVASEHRYGELGTVMTQLGAPGAKTKPRPIPPVPTAAETIAAGAPDEDKNVEVAKSVLAALEAGKKDTDFTNLLADDIEQDGLFHLEMSKGKDGAKKFYKSFTSAFPDAKFETTKTLGIGDYAIVESVLKATHKGALGSIQPTKKPIAIHLVDILKIKDGKVARAWTYQNSLELQHQLGLFNVAATVPASQASPASVAKPDASKPDAPKPAAEKPGAAGGGKGNGGGGGKDTGGGGGKGTGGGGGGGGGKDTGGGGGKGTGGGGGGGGGGKDTGGGGGKGTGGGGGGGGKK